MGFLSPTLQNTLPRERTGSGVFTFCWGGRRASKPAHPMSLPSSSSRPSLLLLFLLMFFMLLMLLLFWGISQFAICFMLLLIGLNLLYINSLLLYPVLICASKTFSVNIVVCSCNWCKAAIQAKLKFPCYWWWCFPCCCCFSDVLFHRIVTNGKYLY